MCGHIYENRCTFSTCSPSWRSTSNNKSFWSVFFHCYQRYKMNLSVLKLTLPHSPTKGLFKNSWKGIFRASSSPVRLCFLAPRQSEQQSRALQNRDFCTSDSDLCHFTFFFVWLEFHYRPSVMATQAGKGSSHPHWHSALCRAAYQRGLLQRYHCGSPAVLSDKHKWI